MYKIIWNWITSISILIIVIVQIVNLSPISNQEKKECGDLFCSRYEYCTQTDHICHSCEIVCSKGNNNYDSNRCTADCQDYLHDQMYTRKDDGKIESDLWTLKLLMVVTLALTALTLSVLFIIFFMKVKRWKNNKKRSNTTLPSVIYNNKCEKPVPVRARQTQPQQQRRYDNNNTGGSLSSREPSESALPEYTYDNPALAPSPTNHI